MNVSVPLSGVKLDAVPVCRICSSRRITKRGDVEFYFGYDWPIYDCAACGCRFTLHDPSIYDLLYAERGSCYNRYLGLAETAKEFFDRGDRNALRAALAQVSKYNFIIDEIDHEPASARLLEIGCSRGHLTSYFILAQRAVIGVDTSPTALAAATAAFGDHFVTVGDPRIQERGPYDVIYHVGTIGCLADPIGMTRDLLGMLKPGGRLLFNAPNRDACPLRNQLWFDSAPPPDVVTLFPPGFWQHRFADFAEVEETIEDEPPLQNTLIALRVMAGRQWHKPLPIALQNSNQFPAPVATGIERLWDDFERLVRRVGPLTGLLGLVAARPQEYGLFVKMRKH